MPSSSMDLDCCPDPNNNRIKIWCDGCYDMAHFGHANNLRQAKGLGDYLCVGVHSDEEIAQHKSCPPVFTSEERYEMIRSIKWVDEVVEAAPYVTTVETLDKHGCHYCAHGNDITTTQDGTDTYQMVKDAGRYKEVERTQGVSTTKLIERIIQWGEGESETDKGNGDKNKKSSTSPYTGTHFLSTTRKLLAFADLKDPPRDARVVYVDGTFDIFHPGHVAFLKKAQEFGNFVIVGIHDDATVLRLKGKSPVMNLQERVQCVLGCRYVNEVVIAAPETVDKELLDHLNVSVVLHGKINWGANGENGNEKNPYEEPMNRGIFHLTDSGSSLTTEKIVDRVKGKRDLYQKRNKDKEKKERELFTATTNNSNSDSSKPQRSIATTEE